MSLPEKVALVTGASRGIGKAIALSIGSLPDMFVVGSATTNEGAESITAYLKAAGVGGRGVVLDISNPSSIETLLEWFAKSNQGTPSILVNNAGVTSDNLFLRMQIEEWEKVISTNLTGTYRLIHGCIRSMIKQRFGRIVNISSVVGVTGNAGQTNYAASKAGVIGLTKSLAREVGSRGITVNVVAPGFIDTDMTQKLSEDQRTKLLEQIPLGRMGNPEDIAKAVTFLVSDAAAYITGETLHVNGGMHMC